MNWQDDDFFQKNELRWTVVGPQPSGAVEYRSSVLPKNDGPEINTELPRNKLAKGLAVTGCSLNLVITCAAIYYFIINSFEGRNGELNSERHHLIVFSCVTSLILQVTTIINILATVQCQNVAVATHIFLTSLLILTLLNTLHLTLVVSKKHLNKKLMGKHLKYWTGFFGIVVPLIMLCIIEVYLSAAYQRNQVLCWLELSYNLTMFQIPLLLFFFIHIVIFFYLLKIKGNKTSHNRQKMIRYQLYIVFLITFTWAMFSIGPSISDEADKSELIHICSSALFLVGNLLYASMVFYVHVYKADHILFHPNFDEKLRANLREERENFRHLGCALRDGALNMGEAAKNKVKSKLIPDGLKKKQWKNNNEDGGESRSTSETLSSITMATSNTTTVNV